MKISRVEFDAGLGSNPHQYRQVLIDSGVPAPLAQEATKIRFVGVARTETERETLLAVAQILLKRTGR